MNTTMPRLIYKNGYWFCVSLTVALGRVVGKGATPKEAYDDMMLEFREIA